MAALTEDHPSADRSVRAGALGRRLRVALACPGVGLEQRGFERIFYDLFHLIGDDLDVMLFKGGGERNAREIVLRFAPRNGRLVKILPVHRLFGRTPMHSECMTFALALLPHLRGDRFDVVHTIDPPLTRVLYKIRNALRMNFRQLYTEGTAMPPGDYPPADHIQQISAATYDIALRHGIPAPRMTLLPLGFHPRRFAITTDRAELRRRYGVPADQFVILCVAALNRYHKRVDHVIDEAARLPGDFLLWLDGSMDFGDPSLIPYAQQRLGNRVRITRVPTECVGELYKLADVMVLASCHEGFGLVIVEALSAGLPVITHNGPHFRWVHPCPHSHVDMEEKGALAALLAALRRHPEQLAQMRHSAATRERFDWACLKERYLDLYEHVSQLAPVRR